MDFIKKTLELIKSPIGSIVLKFIPFFIKMGIKWTPTKTDDYYALKIAFEIIETQKYAKELAGIPLTTEEQRVYVNTKINLDIAYKAMMDYKEAKKK